MCDQVKNKDICMLHLLLDCEIPACFSRPKPSDIALTKAE